MNNTNAFLRLAVPALCLGLAVGCSKNSDDAKVDDTFKEQNFRDTSVNMMQTAMIEATSDAGAVTVRSEPIQIMEACAYGRARGACQNNMVAVKWDGCTAGGAVVTGTTVESYMGPGAPTCQLVGNGSTVNRKIETQRTFTFSNKSTIVSDMEPGTAFDGTTFPDAGMGTTITRSETGASNGQICTAAAPCHHIVVHGIQNTMRGPFGALWFDHIVTSDLTSVGARSQGHLNVTGTATVWNQRTNTKAVTAMNNLRWGDVNCCYPTSGSITAALTGGTVGTVSLTFSATCGEAMFTDLNGAQSNVPLNQCQP